MNIYKHGTWNTWTNGQILLKSRHGLPFVQKSHKELIWTYKYTKEIEQCPPRLPRQIHLHTVLRLNTDKPPRDVDKNIVYILSPHAYWQYFVFMFRLMLMYDHLAFGVYLSSCVSIQSLTTWLRWKFYVLCS